MPGWAARSRHTHDAREASSSTFGSRANGFPVRERPLELRERPPRIRVRGVLAEDRPHLRMRTLRATPHELAPRCKAGSVVCQPPAPHGAMRKAPCTRLRLGCSTGSHGEDLPREQSREQVQSQKKPKVGNKHPTNESSTVRCCGRAGEIPSVCGIGVAPGTCCTRPSQGVKQTTIEEGTCARRFWPVATWGSCSEHAENRVCGEQPCALCALLMRQRL